MSYVPREFWERRLREHFDLRGTGETGLSLAYNEACYRLRTEVLERALRKAAFDPRGKRVLDVGCGTGFFTGYYLERGARVTGIDLTETSVERLREHFPQARFECADLSDLQTRERYDLVNVFDVMYHIIDDGRWEAALRNACAAVVPGGLLLYTDVFAASAAQAAHNRTRPRERHRAILEACGMKILLLHATHVLLNRDLGPFRFLNRFPRWLLRADRILLRVGVRPERANQLLVARKTGG